jgi:hypothetical protein
MLQIQARPLAKPARHSPEAKPMADGQDEATWGAEGEAVVIYCEPLATLDMRHPRLFPWVNKIAVFTIFKMSIEVNSIRARAKKMSGNGDHYGHLTHSAMLFMQL